MSDIKHAQFLLRAAIDDSHHDHPDDDQVLIDMSRRDAATIECALLAACSLDQKRDASRRRTIARMAAQIRALQRRLANAGLDARLAPLSEIDNDVRVGR